MRFTRFLRSTAFAAAMLATGAAFAGQAMEVLKSATCGCCHEWVAYMQAEGFDVTAIDVSDAELAAAKTAAGLSQDLVSCHTAKIDGYVVEGHVPAREVERLLSERPDAIGLSVPGMPYGSPGMGDPADADVYDVLLVKRDGSTEVFASYR